MLGPSNIHQWAVHRRIQWSGTPEKNRWFVRKDRTMLTKLLEDKLLVMLCHLAKRHGNHKSSRQKLMQTNMKDWSTVFSTLVSWSEIWLLIDNSLQMSIRKLKRDHYFSLLALFGIIELSNVRRHEILFILEKYEIMLIIIKAFDKTKIQIC